MASIKTSSSQSKRFRVDFTQAVRMNYRRSETAKDVERRNTRLVGSRYSLTSVEAGVVPALTRDSNTTVARSARDTFTINPERMTELRKALLNLSPDHKTIPQYFQALLTTSV